MTIEENIECVEGSLALMSAINQHSWAYEINRDLIAPLDANRKVKTIILTSWIFEQLWDIIINKGIETSVDLKLSSDTYELKAVLRYNQRETKISLELLS